MHPRATVATTRFLGLALALCGCARETRFALRPVVTRLDDERPFAHAPRHADDLNDPYSVDNGGLRQLSEATRLARRRGEARDVNALDEVPDSSWFTNRTPSPAEVATGPCRDAAPPALPLTITSSKMGGLTPGFFVRDATGRRYALKFDQFPRIQPEMNTANDAVVTRLYWALGYNAPCNNVAFLGLDDVRVSSHAWYADAVGVHHPMSLAHAQHEIAHYGYRVGAQYRFGLSLFLPGDVLGPWAAEGRRADDPNDLIRHEDRRELRGERLLAAWVNHWDARAPNSLDSFVPAPGGGGGYVRHYEFDFGDSLGADCLDPMRSPRQAFTYTVHPGVILADALTFGAIHRPWDDTATDPVVPFLHSNFDVAHFDPGAWVPANPSPRFDAADDQDMAWMARRIVHLERAHLDAAFAAGRYGNPRVPQRLAEILMGRRARLLAWSFARVSPLTDIAVQPDGQTLCATDLGITTGLSDAAHVATTATAWRGAEDPSTASPGLSVSRGDASGAICVRLPPHDDSGAPDDSAARYTIVELTRWEQHRATRLRAHLYDLGPQRGYVLAGLVR